MTLRGITLMVLAVLVLPAAGYVLLTPVYRLPCGNRESRLEHYAPARLKSLRKKHYCTADQLLEDLRLIHNLRRIHLSDSLAEMIVSEDGQSEFPDSKFYRFECTGTGKNWECHVARTPALPGNYLMTADGSVYFNENRPATTSDEALNRSLKFSSP